MSKKTRSESAKQKLKRVEVAIDEAGRNIRQWTANSLVNHLRSILRPGANGVPFAKEDAASHIEGTEFGT